VREIGDDLAGKVFDGRDHIGQPGRPIHAARHGVELGRGQRLHKNRPRVLLDGPDPERAIRPHARKDHADAPVALVVGQRAQEKIDGQAQPARRHRGQQVQHPVQDVDRSWFGGIT